MRLFLATLAALLAPTAHATTTIHLPAETGAQVDADDWSIPLQRCYFSSEHGASVADGAERCTLEFALPLEAGRRLVQVRALYTDDDLVSDIDVDLHTRDATTGVTWKIATASDHAPNLTQLDGLTLEPDYLVGKTDALSVVIEIRGDTVLKTVTYEYE